jgi:hypothetical protein
VDRDHARRKLAQPRPTSRGLLRVGSTREIVYRDSSFRPDASFALPSAPPLASGAQVRDVSPEEETSHAPRAAKGDAQLVPASETR